MNCFGDTSVLFRYLLSGDEDFKRVKEFEKVGSSELLFIESSRVLHRYRIEAAITDNQLEEAITHLKEVYDALYIFEMNSRIKQRAAGAFPTIIGTLDAIH